MVSKLGSDIKLVAPQKNEQDPLVDLYKMDNGEDVTIDREAAILIARLLENVEEFYELREKIRNIMVEDHITETKVMSLFQTLLQGLRVEKSYMEKNIQLGIRNFI